PPSSGGGLLLWGLGKGHSACLRLKDGGDEGTHGRAGYRGSDNFAVSPDGSLIVAESTKDIAVPLWREPGTAYGEDYGFVILDSSTGAVLFKEKLRRPGFLTDQLLPLFFSADGKQVVANFNSLDASNVTDINVYSIAR